MQSCVRSAVHSEIQGITAAVVFDAQFRQLERLERHLVEHVGSLRVQVAARLLEDALRRVKELDDANGDPLAAHRALRKVALLQKLIDRERLVFLLIISTLLLFTSVRVIDHKSEVLCLIGSLKFNFG